MMFVPRNHVMSGLGLARHLHFMVMRVPVSLGMMRGFSMNDGAKPAGSSASCKIVPLISRRTHRDWLDGCMQLDKARQFAGSTTSVGMERFMVSPDEHGMDSHDLQASHATRDWTTRRHYKAAKAAVTFLILLYHTHAYAFHHTPALFYNNIETKMSCMAVNPCISHTMYKGALSSRKRPDTSIEGDAACTSQLALEVERDVGVTLAEVVKSVAAVVAAVALGRVRYLEGQQVRVFAGRLTGHFDALRVRYGLGALVPGDLRHRVRLQYALHYQDIALLADRRLFRETRRLAVGYSTRHKFRSHY